MSTPPDERPPAGEPTGATPQRRKTTPLVWLLVLIAVAAFVWYFANRPDEADVPLDPVSPTGEILDEDDDTADVEEPTPAPATADPAPAAPAAADRAAEPASRVQPDYPAAALRSREEGTVLLRVEVDAQGRPGAVDIERSSRSRELDRAAREAVAQWTFSPAIEDGEPVASTVTVPVDFTVED